MASSPSSTGPVCGWTHPVYVDAKYHLPPSSIPYDISRTGFSASAPDLSNSEPSMEKPSASASSHYRPSLYRDPAAGRRTKKEEEIAVPRIPRPRNSFIIFRCDFIRKHAEGRSRTMPPIAEKKLSKLAGEAWRVLPKEEKEVYAKLSHQERSEHKKKYPEYRYQPKRRQGTGSKKTAPGTKSRREQMVSFLARYESESDCGSTSDSVTSSSPEPPGTPQGESPSEGSPTYYPQVDWGWHTGGDYQMPFGRLQRGPSTYSLPEGLFLNRLSLDGSLVEDPSSGSSPDCFVQDPSLSESDLSTRQVLGQLFHRRQRSNVSLTSPISPLAVSTSSAPWEVDNGQSGSIPSHNFYTSVSPSELSLPTFSGLPDDFGQSDSHTFNHQDTFPSSTPDTGSLQIPTGVIDDDRTPRYSDFPRNVQGIGSASTSQTRLAVDTQMPYAGYQTCDDLISFSMGLDDFGIEPMAYDVSPLDEVDFSDIFQVDEAGH